jgi:hypothetical protein
MAGIRETQVETTRPWIRKMEKTAHHAAETRFCGNSPSVAAPEVHTKKSRSTHLLTKRYLLEQFHRGTDVIHTEEENDRNRGNLTPEKGLEPKRVAPGVLRGEWDLSNAHIQELAERFRLSPDLFLRKDCPTTSS